MKKIFQAITVCVLSITSLISLILFSFVAPFVSLWAANYGIYYDYKDWKQVEIPTDSTLRAKVRLPEDWDFVSDEGRLYIKPR